MEELIGQLESYNLQLSGIILNIAVAVIIVLAGFILGKLLGRLVRGALHEVELDNVLRKIGIKFSFEKIIYLLIEYLIYITSIVIALNRLKITNTVLQIIVIVLVFLIVIFALIYLKDLVPNMIAGFFLHKKKQVKKGDMINVQNTTGKIKNIGLLETEVVMKNKDRIYIPNSTLLNGKLAIKKRKN